MANALGIDLAAGKMPGSSIAPESEKRDYYRAQLDDAMIVSEMIKRSGGQNAV